jgi:hypothetical protein
MQYVWAATVYVESTQTTVRVGDEFYIDVLLDTQQEIANTVFGSVTFDTNLFTYQEASTKDSSITFWIDQPQEYESGVIRFSGVTPGGFSGAAVGVVRLYFSVHAQGQGEIELSDVGLLLHDGLGTAMSVDTRNIHIAVVAGDQRLKIRPYSDEELPEPFVPIVATDPELYDGRPVLIFSTQDKDSGISHYTVREGIFGRSKDAVSPYLLTHDPGSVEIRVSAVDKAGNIREAKLYPHTGWFLQVTVYRVLSILGLSLVLICILVLYMRNRNM